jgi:hypothetical protein
LWTNNINRLQKGYYIAFVYEETRKTQPLKKKRKQRSQMPLPPPSTTTMDQTATRRQQRYVFARQERKLSPNRSSTNDEDDEYGDCDGDGDAHVKKYDNQNNNNDARATRRTTMCHTMITSSNSPNGPPWTLPPAVGCLLHGTRPANIHPAASPKPREVELSSLFRPIAELLMRLATRRLEALECVGEPDPVTRIHVPRSAARPVLAPCREPKV